MSIMLTALTFSFFCVKTNALAFTSSIKNIEVGI
jgi:hypothetical protein